MAYRIKGNFRRDFLFPSFKEIKLEEATKCQRHYFYFSHFYITDLSEDDVGYMLFFLKPLH